MHCRKQPSRAWRIAAYKDGALRNVQQQTVPKSD
jgi:hypothetical protein